MTRYRLLVVGPEDIDLPSMRPAWNDFGADLIGPVRLQTALTHDLTGLHGALIDIASGDDSTLFALSERLEEAMLPSLYVVVNAGHYNRTRVFVLSDRPNEIGNILASIFRDGDDGIRH